MATDITPSLDEPDSCGASATSKLLAAERAETLSTIFKALADPTRVRLLRYLADSEAGTVCACHLPEALGITQPTLSFHMRKLHEAGLVGKEKRGRWVHWTVDRSALRGVCDFLALPTDGDGCC